MPITPFHFGPGAALHAISPRHVSFLAFCAANVLTDLESLYFLVTGQFPLHRFLHTYVGATVTLCVTVAGFAATCSVSRRVHLPNLFGWKRLAYRQVAVGAGLGSYSHIVLDSVMHSDIRPLAPFGESNSLLAAISISSLHLGCVLAGGLGLVLLALRRGFRGKFGPQDDVLDAKAPRD